MPPVYKNTVTKICKSQITYDMSVRPSPCQWMSLFVWPPTPSWQGVIFPRFLFFFYDFSRILGFNIKWINVRVHKYIDRVKAQSTYRVTHNKLHHLLAILYLIFEVNITQVSYVVQCIIVNEVQFNKVLFWKCLSEKNISNCAVIRQTVRFEISLKIFKLWMFSDI